MCLYSNFQKASDSVANEVDEKIAAIRQSREYLSLSGEYDKSIADLDSSIAFMRMRNRNAKSSAEPFVDKILAATEKRKALISEKRDLLYSRFEKPIKDNLAIKRERSNESNFFGFIRGITYGLAMPLASLTCMFFSTRKYFTKIQSIAFIVGSWVAQAIACYVSFKALVMQGGDTFGAAIYTGALFVCAPMIYRGAVIEAQKSVERLQNKLEDARKLKEEQANQREQDRIAKSNKAKREAAEKSRQENLVRKAKKLIGGNAKNGNLVATLPKDAWKAAEWFIDNGEPYGMQTKLAKHVGKTDARFTQILTEIRRKRSEAGI